MRRKRKKFNQNTFVRDLDKSITQTLPLFTPEQVAGMAKIRALIGRPCVDCHGLTTFHMGDEKKTPLCDECAADRLDKEGHTDGVK